MLPKIFKIIGIMTAIAVLGMAGLYYYMFRPALSVDEKNPPKLVQADWIDLSKITQISKFRSDAGHDYSDGNETCRSMKHYFIPFNQEGDINKLAVPTPEEPAITIYAPADGEIVDISTERTPVGRQVHLRPDGHPEIVFRLFHIYLVDGVNVGSKVKAGQQIGKIGAHQGTDIAVEARTIGKVIDLSYFDLMPDSIFAKYQARGIKDRSELTVSKEYRDAHPMKCLGGESEQFDYPQGYDRMQDYVTLK